jgi:serine/threonine protein kinase
MGELLGEGGFAKVRKCTRKLDGSEVVMKVFQKFKLTTEEKRKSVMREIEIMKCIKHPSIIRIIDFYETNDSINIIMEYFSKSSLANYARTHRPLSDNSLKTIIRQIAEAVAYLHSMKIAHRDIKPENVLINEEGEIKLIDMGLSMMG